MEWAVCARRSWRPPRVPRRCPACRSWIFDQNNSSALGIAELQGALLVECDHRDASVDVTEDLRLRVASSSRFACAVASSSRFENLARRSCRCCQNATQPSTDGGTSTEPEADEVLVPDPAVDAADLDAAHPEAVLGLAEADEHVVAAYRSAP